LGRRKRGIPQLRADLASPNPDKRAAAADALKQGLAGRLAALAACLNSMIRQRSKAQRLRGLDHWLDASRREQGASSQLTEAIIPTVSEHAPTACSFYDLKRRALGLPALYERDRLAPWPGLASRWTWSEACALVLESFGCVSNRLSAAARQVFESGRIHADPEAGGSAGPFCLPAGVRPEPFVRLRFRGGAGDVLTLAHEMGHAAHHVLSHSQGPLQDTAAPIMAETVACLAEELILRRLMELRRPQAALQRLERTMTLVFRQTALLRFEERMYAIGAERSFGPADLNQAWAEAHQAVYGASLRLDADSAHDWALVPHFYFSPGYVAAYVLGRLAAANLAQRLRRRHSGLKEALMQVLTQGLGPGVDKQYQNLGLDPDSPSFLNDSLIECRRLIQQTAAACNLST
jgi:oligoendopeptidase F